MKEKNLLLRKKVVLAMELLTRSLNDEELEMVWLSLGVADGDIPYGSIDPAYVDDCYVADDNDFAGLMDVFLDIMKRARKSGLYVDGVVSKYER